MTEDDHIFIAGIVAKVQSNPALFPHIIHAMTMGIEKGIDQARQDQAQWEAVAIQAIAYRAFGKNKSATVAMIEKVLPRACFRWDSVLEEMKK